MPARILVIRFSALGDVAMTVPVLRCALQQYPQLELVVVSRAAFKPLFEGLERTQFVSADLKGKHKGLAGMMKLAGELAETDTHIVADLHNVLRSRLLGFFLQLRGIKLKRINKGRGEKKALTRKGVKVLKQLPTSHERYAEVFRKAGFPIDLSVSVPEQRFNNPPFLMEAGINHIGIAPFAQHLEKRYPLEAMEKVIAALVAEKSNRVYIFGGGKQETDQATKWENAFPGLVSLAGKFTLAEELSVMKRLSVMVSMDSANMHLASLVGTRVVSVWGATHRFAGFYGWKQDVQDIVETELYCRPCSVFGNKPCYRGDHACMNNIAPEQIIAKI